MWRYRLGDGGVDVAGTTGPQHRGARHHAQPGRAREPRRQDRPHEYISNLPHTCRTFTSHVKRTACRARARHLPHACQSVNKVRPRTSFTYHMAYLTIASIASHVPSHVTCNYEAFTIHLLYICLTFAEPLLHMCLAFTNLPHILYTYVTFTLLLPQTMAGEVLIKFGRPNLTFGLKTLLGWRPRRLKNLWQ